MLSFMKNRRKHDPDPRGDRRRPVPARRHRVPRPRDQHAAPREPAAGGGRDAGADTTKDPVEAYAVIVERNLFRTTDGPRRGPDGPRHARGHHLPIDLYGTIAGEGGQGLRGHRGEGQKKQRLYKIGDKVAGATIVKILRNAVVLRVGEKDQVLRKRRSSPGGQAECPRPGCPATASAPARRPPAPAGRLRRRPRVRPPTWQALLTQARVTPHVTAGSSGSPTGS